MFKSAAGSKQLLLAKVVKVVNSSKIKVKFLIEQKIIQKSSIL
jgi:hypothetical protein